MSSKSFFALPADRECRVRIIHATSLCVFVFYGIRALRAEIVRLGFVAELISLCLGGLVLVCVVYWFVLLFHGFRAMLNPQQNGLLFLVLIVGACIAWFAPELPLREEIKLFFNRDQYEQIVEQGRSIYASGTYDCIELTDKDLAWTCVIIEDNFAMFNIYRDVFSLLYSYDEQIPKAADCNWNGYVWKQIDKNWYICRNNSS